MTPNKAVVLQTVTETCFPACSSLTRPSAARQHIWSFWKTTLCQPVRRSFGRRARNQLLLRMAGGSRHVDMRRNAIVLGSGYAAYRERVSVHDAGAEGA